LLDITVVKTVAGDAGKVRLMDGGLATSATLCEPNGVAVDASGNIYIADTWNGRIRMVTKTTGIITTVAGTGMSGYSGDGGLATSATMRYLRGIAVDASGDIYIADSGSNRIRLVTKTTGIITTVAGNGTRGYSGDGSLATSATLTNPYGVAVDASGNIYIADTYNGRIRLVTKTTGIITTVAGNGTRGYSGDGGLATSSTLTNPYGVAVDASGNIYIADSGSNRIRLVTKTTGIITTVAGDGTYGYSGDGGLATSATMRYLRGIAVDASGNIYIADSGSNRIRMVTKTTGVITTVAGDGTYGYSGDGGLATSATMRHPFGVAVDASGNIFFADNFNHRIRLATKITGVITTVAGDDASGYSGDGGLATSATLTNPYGVAVDASGNIYIADSYNHRIRLVTKTTGIITTAAGDGTRGYSGDGGLATSATLTYPYGVSVDASGNIYIAESHRIRLVTKITGIITTVAGDDASGYSGDGGLATSATLNSPYGVAVDASGNIYIADSVSNRIRLVTKTTGIITTAAGDGTRGYSGDGGEARLSSITYPTGIAIDASGSIYVTDRDNHRLRVLLLADVSTASPTNSPTVAPSPTLSPTPSPNTVSTPTPTPSPNTVSTPSPTPAPTRSPTLVATPSSSNVVFVTSSSPGKCLCGDPSAFNVLACYATLV
jgi:trimeric autotransporter adhesin